MQPLNPRHSLHILLVEDDPINSRVVTALLQTLGHRVTVEKDGIGALTQFYRASWDLLLLDIGLPDIDGYRISRRIRQNVDSKRAGLPIVAITASQDAAIVPQVLAAGMNGLLRKPILEEDFCHVLQNLQPTFLAPPPAAAEIPTAPSTHSTEAILDEQHWQRMAPLMERAALLETVVMFQQSGPDYLQQAIQGVADGRAHEAAQALHKLAGAASNMALGRLGDEARRLEKLCYGAPPPPIAKQLLALQQLMQRSLRALERMANMV
ncbi:response regulator receiver protein [Magnetococcus marinus MC-1]|uniref:Response regulator receiver protein n=1 Tax=Magnetococcus marinus (strain ATCC BAA-1437 / JCM 17883 / MC-1) TaxID=156889 RepID=A0LD12_MAGMM|nr:response regulator [Magnetococcus marinus]ABK45855.1 response regulator receiver protein [Magnetococcus marinus MC-1]